ncbi:hypothetical protein BHM03_00042137 [Ensete ventricosum]|nr:hypothetical protein BHM03_00042137 [Ensete ventricosum]
MCSSLAIEEVIGVARIYKNSDGLLFKESSNFHFLWVGVIGQHMHCIVGRLGLFLHGFIFEFEVFFIWYAGDERELDLSQETFFCSSVADIRRKMVTKRSESEGNCDGGGKRGQQQHRLWLRCDFVAAGGVGCSMVAAAIGGRWGSDVHDYCGGGHQRLEPETVDVVFNLLLTAIKIVGSERLLRAAM